MCSNRASFPGMKSLIKSLVKTIPNGRPVRYTANKGYKCRCCNAQAQVRGACFNCYQYAVKVAKLELGINKPRKSTKIVGKGRIKFVG